MRKLLFLAVLGGVAYGLRKLSEDSHPDFDRDLDEYGAEPDDDQRVGRAAMSDKESEDARLDEALRDSFPASDPPSMSR